MFCLILNLPTRNLKVNERETEGQFGSLKSKDGVLKPMKETQDQWGRLKLMREIQD